ncbi:MAG TPA: hypothetical protein VKA61_05055, partial [Sphingomicrobium sp.]|nr:hypothetical protein [Sphingomicrobium sp.]
IAALRLTIAFSTGAIALAVGYWAESWQLVTGILGVGALGIAYIEWMLERRESAINKFYERLKISNDYRKSIKDTDLGMSDENLYVFSEIDNLEFVVEQYRIGYISPALALRAVNTFRGRFGIKGVAERISEFAGIGCGYSPETLVIVRGLLEKHLTVVGGRDPC